VATAITRKDGQSFELPFTASTEFTFSNAPFKIQRVWVVCSASHANGTAQLVVGDTSSTTAVTNAMTCAVQDTPADATLFYAANANIAAGTNLSVKTTNSAAGTVYVQVAAT
jgi:uncharacterized cupredoxin-like copper-binding protein